MASSSHFTSATSSSRSYKYDVFLSFRGEDTRKTFVDHLYSSLKQHLIEVYKDDEALPRGESIDQSLFEAIEESQMAVIVFSKNYADSSWCLDELAHIMKCKDDGGLIVLPIFYDVEPTEVRNQKGKFEEAFTKQVAKNITKAETWRKALVDVGNISGWESKNIADGHEAQFIKNVVDTIMKRLFALNSCVDEDLIGIRARVHDLESLLDIESRDVRMVGIWGVGGGGKTTLATSVYMKISQHFQSQCIVENVRERTRKDGLNKLQENILSVIFKSETKVHSVVEGKNMMKNRLHRRQVLILLDDVDNLDQLEALAGKHNWFGSGSRIIITTRDEHLLRTHKVGHIYPIKLLSDDEAILLFKKHAYNEEDPVEDYGTLSLRAISYASGLPLSLKILGSFLYDKNKNEWISALKKLKDIPNQEVMNILKISYDGLETSEKELFLDIACFFRGNLGDLSFDAIEMHKACGFHPQIGIKVLRQKALITLTNYEYGVRFDMHDLVQEMGHYIVRGEHPKNPEKHTRVWKPEEIKEMCCRNATMENDTIEAIKYRHEHSIPFCKLLSNLKKLRSLIVVNYHLFGYGDEDEDVDFLSSELRYIYWDKYPTSSPFPDAFQPINLVFLKLHWSKQKELWKGNKHFPHLKVLKLGAMLELLSTPDFSGLPRLQKMTLNASSKLKEIHSSLENHTALEYLYVSYCSKLRSIPTISRMKNMKSLVIKDCSLKDGEIPSGIGKLSNLEELDLSWNDFSRLDFNFSQLMRLKSLNLSGCHKLLELPELPSSLTSLGINQCRSLTTIDEDFTKSYEQLCQVSIDGRHELGKRLLQQMLKGNAIENGTMHFFVDGLEIAKEFTPPLVRGSSYRLKLPENWCIDFSGFLLCAVYPSYCNWDLPPMVLVNMRQVSDIDSEDDVVWEKTDQDIDDDRLTCVWYVSFGSLRHTVWWDQTYNAISFELESPCSNGFRVKLIEKKSGKGLTETSSTDTSSHYTPKISIYHDSASELKIDLRRYAANMSWIYTS